MHGRFDLLRTCLDSIPGAAGGIHHRIIIYDNGSPWEEADAFYAEIGFKQFAKTSWAENRVLIRNRHNAGFPRACNDAANRSNAPFLFFLNSDIELHSNSLRILLDDMKSDSSIGVMGMKLIFPPDVTGDPARPAGMLQHIGIFTDVRGEFRHTFVGWNPNHPKVLAVREAYAVTGAALLTRRKLWTQIGGFCLEYGVGSYEDIDYCLSVRELGYNICVNNEASAYHATNATAIKYGINYPLEFNKLIFLRRWRPKLEYWEYKVL